MEAYSRQSATCDRARAWVSLRADDELSEFECALLDAHLQRCPACSSFAVDVGDLTALLRAEPLETLPQPVAVPTRRRRHVAMSTRAAASAAALVVTVAGAFAVLDRSGPRPPTTLPSRITGNEDLRLARLLQRRQLTAVFQAKTIKVVHAKGAPSRPAGGPVRNVLSGQKDVTAGR